MAQHTVPLLGSGRQFPERHLCSGSLEAVAGFCQYCVFRPTGAMTEKSGGSISGEPGAAVMIPAEPVRSSEKKTNSWDPPCLPDSWPSVLGPFPSFPRPRQQVVLVTVHTPVLLHWQIRRGNPMRCLGKWPGQTHCTGATAHHRALEGGAGGSLGQNCYTSALQL